MTKDAGREFDDGLPDKQSKEANTKRSAVLNASFVEVRGGGTYGISQNLIPVIEIFSFLGCHTHSK